MPRVVCGCEELTAGGSSEDDLPVCLSSQETEPPSNSKIATVDEAFRRARRFLRQRIRRTFTAEDSDPRELKRLRRDTLTGLALLNQDLLSTLDLLTTGQPSKRPITTP